MRRDLVAEAPSRRSIEIVRGSPAAASRAGNLICATRRSERGLPPGRPPGRSGRIQDPQPATDADTLAAYALLRYTGPDAERLHDAGRQLAAAVLDGEATIVGGGPLLLAGPWAMQMSPPVVNPSYLMPSVFAALGRFTGDDRWRRAATISTSLIRQLTIDGRTLPTDWAQLSNERLVPITAPSGGAPIQYGLDAARLPVWLGTGCAGDDRRLAARWWDNALSHDDREAHLALSTDGTPINQQTNPLPLLAAAAAASAAGDTDASKGLLGRAAEQSRSTPTYYGDAWLALATALLDRTLDPCRDAAHG
jgi:endoglucanase